MHFSTHLDVDLVALESGDRLTLLLDLAAPVVDGAAGRPPATVEVVLDRSGSMGGERLEVAKAAIGSLITRLAPADRLGVVAFDDEVSVVLPAGALADRGAARAAVAELAPGGLTNLSGGLLRGLQEVRRAGDGAGPSTLVLVSDGSANVGETDHGRLEAVARAARARGTTVSTIGLGLGYDEALLGAVARGGAGNAHFAEEADAAGVAIASEVDGLLDVSASAVSLLVAPAAGVDGVTVWNDLPGHVVEEGIMLELGDLYGGEERKLLLSLSVPAMASLGLARVAGLTLRWVSLPELEEHTIEVPVHVNVVPGDVAAGRIPDARVRTELAFQQAQMARREAADRLRDGDVEGSVELGAETAAMLREAAAAAPQDLAFELQAEAGMFDDMALRSHSEDLRRLAKEHEAEAARKSRKRGRGPR